MNWKCKAVMFLTLLIFCVGSVCATEPNNTTHTNLTDNQNTINEVNNIINKALEKKDIEIKALQDNDIKQSNEIQQLKDNNTQLDKRVKDLEYSKLTQSNRIKSLKIDIKNLEDSNKALNVKINNQNSIINELNNTVNNQSVIINSLKTDNEALNVKIDNQNSIINNQSVTINELNNKLELQINEIKQLQADKDKLNAEINKLKDEKCSIYEKLLESPKKEDYEQLKKDITNKDKQIQELNNTVNKLTNEIKILNDINSVNRKDVSKSLKALSSTNIQNIKCGKYTFKLEDYLKIPLIREGKKNVLKFKKENGRLPKYVTIAGIKVSQNIYKKLYNIK